MAGIMISTNGSNKQPTSTREHKGKSLLEFPDSYVAIDIETTGLDPIYDEIIEIAALKIQNGSETDRFHSGQRCDHNDQSDQNHTFKQRISPCLFDPQDKIINDHSDQQHLHNINQTDVFRK